MNPDKILENIEYKCIEDNEEIARLVITETLREMNINIKFLEDDFFIQRLNKLKREYIYESENIDVFFEILEKYGYNSKHEIIGAINRLGNLPDPKKNSELIHKLINSPYIDDITFDGREQFKISSSWFGDINFKLASARYKHNKEMVKYIKNNPLPGRCHNHTLFIRAIFPSYYAVTALCPAPFRGKYYHSFSYDSNNKNVIDLCSNAVVSEQQYKFIFEPSLVSVILNSQISEELRITKEKTNQPIERQALLKIALYKQLLTLKAKAKDPNSPRILTLKTSNNKTPHR